MPIVFYEKETDTRARVTTIHNQPDLLSAERRAEGIELQNIPEAEDRKGQSSVPYINPQTEEFWYEYKDRPPSPEEMAKDYQDKIDALKKAAQIATSSQIKANELSDDDLLSLVKIYPDWNIGIDYSAGDLVNYQNKLYEVIQAHTSQADWAPDTTASLFVEKTPAVVTEWKQPQGSHDAYNTGDRVLYEGETYESTIDNNTWSPEQYSEGWQVV